MHYPALWRRFAAMIYDTLLILAISITYGLISLPIDNIVGIFVSKEQPFTSSLFFQIGWLCVVLGFFCFFWTRAGQTLGMRAWRLKVIQLPCETYPTQLPSLQQCIIRCVVAPIGYSLFFVSLIRHDKQCLHDIASQTQVILTEKGV